jgi:NDP-sugar pyrophosphorylase family protein
MIDAVVLCGGLGTRLRPLTYAVPKPLLPVGGTPIVEHVLGRLEAAGCRHVGLATGFRSELIEQRLGERWGGLTLHYRREEQAMGTGGALNLFRGETADPFLITNGDVLTEIDMRALLDVHREEGAAVTVAVRTIAVPVAYGVIDTEGRRVTGVREKPDVEVPINAGVYAASNAIWDVLPEASYPLTDLMTDCMSAGHPVAAYQFDDYWIDIGAMPDYLKANADVAQAQGLTEQA